MTQASAPSHLSVPFTNALPVDRAAISTLGAPFTVETVSATDSIAALLSERQIDVGEGPGWEAHRSQIAIFVPSRAAGNARWPMFHSVISALDVDATCSFPLTVGTVRIGSVDLYARSAAFTPSVMAEASVLAAAASTDVLRHALEHLNDAPGDDGPYSRREVLQATGMVIAQMGVSADEALLLIRAHAFGTGRSVRAISADITARRIVFRP